MDHTIYTCIRPTYLREFQCDGKSCHSHCCGDWRITVDGETMQKYSKLEPAADREKILSHIIYRKPFRSFGISLGKNYRCPFLDEEDYLCKIQKRYGEDYIADICVTYPRVFYHVDHILEESLAVTCPVAAKLILLSGTPIQFERVSVPYPRKTQVAMWTKKVSAYPDNWQQIQEVCISLLQDRKRSLNQRFLLLLRFLEQTEQQPERKLPDWLQSAQEEGLSSLELPSYIFDAGQHVSFLAKLFTQLYQMNMTPEKLVSLQNSYQDGRKLLLPSLLDAYSEPLENYLVNEFFLRFYPFAFHGPLSYNGKLFVIGSKLLEFSLLLTAIAHQGRLEEKDFLNVIDRISERLDHSQDGMSFLRNSIPEEISDEPLPAFAGYMIG